MAYFLRNLESTEAGKRLQLDEETIKNTMLVYRLKDDKWLYHGPYSEKRELEEDDIVVPVTSCYDGTEPIKQGRVFANVIGSSNDHLENSILTAPSWIKLIYAGILNYELVRNGRSRGQANAIATFESNTCCMLPRYYRYVNNVGEVEKVVQCNVNIPNQVSQIVGGHVVDSIFNQVLNQGQSVALMPICKTHNSGRWVENGEKSIPGAWFYMRTQRPTYAVILRNYISAKRIKEHMSNHTVEKI